MYVIARRNDEAIHTRQLWIATSLRTAPLLAMTPSVPPHSSLLTLLHYHSTAYYERFRLVIEHPELSWGDA